MKILGISCSNVQHKRTESTSTKTCELAGELITLEDDTIQFEMVRLGDYKLANCKFCGHCLEKEACISDDDFNGIYQQITTCDKMILVVPFYAVIPSKLTMITEKINQIYYTAWLKNPDAEFSLTGKQVAIIGHGGTVLKDYPAVEKMYRDLLLKPINYSLSSFGFEVVGLDEENPSGVVFGVAGYTNRDEAIFPDMVHD
jgi:multimeric flavodoxin WrbA